jgi:WD40 repeat protein
VALSPDGETLAAGMKLPTLNPIATLQGHSGPVKVIAYSPDGKTLASGGADGDVRLWETNSGQTRATLE